MTRIGIKIATYSNRKESVSYGPNVITNGTFDVDSDWFKTAGWTISGGTANAAASTGFISQGAVLELGKTYLVTFDVVAYTSGTVRVQCGNTTNGTDRSAIDTYVEELVCSGDTTFYIDGNVSFTGSVDNVIVQEKL